MNTILKQRFKKQSLSKQSAYEALMLIGQGKCHTNEMTAFITSYILQKITVEELLGFKQALMDLCIKMDFSDHETIDICGTGGDGKHSFNISTVTGLVLAGAGYKVTKHGNYGVSSICGSSHVMEYLGYKFTNDEYTLKKQLESANFCMLHAPLFHPAMKFVAPIRKTLKVKTFFNILGPLVNPSSPNYQLIGVYNLEVARLYHYLLQNSSTTYQVIHSLDGYDEISLTGSAKVYSNSNEYILSPEDFSFKPIAPSQLKGGQSVKDSAQILIDILKNDSTKEQKSVVMANTALAIQTIEPNKELTECLHIAQASIESGRAYQTLKKICQ